MWWLYKPTAIKFMKWQNFEGFIKEIQKMIHRLILVGSHTSNHTWKVQVGRKRLKGTWWEEKYYRTSRLFIFLETMNVLFHWKKTKKKNSGPFFLGLVWIESPFVQESRLHAKIHRIMGESTWTTFRSCKKWTPYNSTNIHS